MFDLNDCVLLVGAAVRLRRAPVVARVAADRDSRHETPEAEHDIGRVGGGRAVISARSGAASINNTIISHYIPIKSCTLHNY